MGGYQEDPSLIAHRLAVGSLHWSLLFKKYTVNGKEYRPKENTILLDTGSNRIFVP